MSHRQHPTTFRDATSGQNIASGLLAAVYVEFGSYQWAQHDIDRMAGVFGIVTGGDPHHDAHLARCCDTEPKAFTPGRVPLFLQARIDLGHRDGMSYNDESEWGQIEQDCIDKRVYPYWWIAAPGKSPAECAALRSPIRGVQPVAVQNYWGQAYDQSIILQPNTPAMQFTSPSHFHGTG